MKVLLLTDGVYPYVLGGMQKHSYYLAKYLNRSGTEVHMAHCVYKEAAPQNEIDAPEYIDFNRELISFSSYTFPDGGRLPGHYIRANKAYSVQLYADLKDQLDSFDLIYAQGFTGWEFIRQRKKGAHNVPVFVNLHGYEMFQRAPSTKVRLKLQLMKGIARDLSVGADFVFSFGGQLTEILLKEGVQQRQIIECPIGIESDWLKESIRPTDNQLRKFVFIGRYERRKGIEELSQILKELTTTQTGPFEFHFIGPIPEEFRVKHARLIYHGEIRNPEKIKAILADSDILVVPSYSEGMPTVIMESLAMGLAILGTDVGAISKQIDGNGWLVAAPEVPLLKKAILEAIDAAPEQVDAYKKRSLEKVKAQFLWSQVIQQKVEAMQQAIRLIHSN